MHPLYWVTPLISHTLLRFLLVLPLLKYFAKFKVYGLENLKVASTKHGVIFAANHASEFDPPVVTAAIPFLSKYTPLFFATDELEFFAKKEIFGWRAYIYPWAFVLLLGAYPILKKRKKFEEKLMHTITLLSKKRSVLFFPEGRRTRNGRIQDAQAGIGFLLQHTNSVIIPVGIKGTYDIPSFDKPSRKRFYSGKHTITVIFGKPISKEDIFGENTDSQIDDFKSGANAIMARIEKLLL